ncbi:unnamed protein product [Phytophthora fragariaefolia]|uniref:Unnamed protein product n=1 Tax=Phytophthora fragariaefolia TaxID=1490495 RepID=A0A9W6X1U5_9STRA|nr:unnamed protein product [Phytophthora fragariaefolia]
MVTPVIEAPTSQPTSAGTPALISEAPTPEPTPGVITASPTPTPTDDQVFMFTVPPEEPTTEEPESSPTQTFSSSWDDSESSPSSSSSSSFRGSLSGITITFPPEDNATEQAAAATTTSTKSTASSPTSAGSNGQTATTETASSSGTPVGAIVAATVGAVAVIGAIAAIFVVRHKKQQMEATSPMDDLEWLDNFSNMRTPVQRIPTINADAPTLEHLQSSTRNNRRLRLSMQLYGFVTCLGTMATAVGLSTAIPVIFHNRCSTTIGLYNNTYTEDIEPGCSTTRDLEEGFSGMFRNGWHPQATCKLAACSHRRKRGWT